MEEVKFKFSVDWTKSIFYCGLDVHKYELAVAVYSKDDSGTDFLKTTVFSVDSEGLERFWNFTKKYRPAGFAMEATGVYHHLIYKFLLKKRATTKWPFKIVVVNPADASGIPGKPKFDKIDAKNLAKYLAMGLLLPGKPIVEVLEDLKAIFRIATKIEHDRTVLKNRVKKTLDRAGIRPKGLNFNHDWVREFIHFYIDQERSLGDCLNAIIANKDLFPNHRHKILKNLNKFIPYFDFSLSSAQRAIIRQDMVELDFKTARKSLLAIEIDQLILERPGLRKCARNLSTIPGISPFSAVWILAEIGNILQYSTKRQFLAYCGCCPRVVSSAGKVYSAHISRHSNAYLRTIFYNAAVVVCNFTKMPSTLKEYAERIAQKKGTFSTKLAYCAVAAKIAKITYSILQNNLPFDPKYDKAFKTGKSIQSDERFTVSDRKLLRRTRNLLKRMGDMQNIGSIGEFSTQLADQLDRALQGKKLSD
jgi:transposase